MLKKYKYYSLLFASALLVFTACSDDDDIGATLDVAPSVTGVSPGNFKRGSDDIVLQLAASDGSLSPLSRGTLTLLDSADNELVSITQDLSGTVDTVRMDNATSGLSARGLGTYKIVGSATDTGGLSTFTADTVTFEIFDLPFNANIPSLYFLGELYGWGGTAEDRADQAFELVADNTWTLDSLEVSGQFKFSVGPNFDENGTIVNEDWGDTNCMNGESADGIMESNMQEGGNGNTNCGYDGIFNIAFNDETFAYTMVPVISLEQNFNSLFLVGNFNNFEGDGFAFSLTEDNIWTLANVALAPGDVYKFAESSDLMGQLFGEGANDSTAAAFGSNIAVEEPGIFDIEFNDVSFNYRLTKISDLNLSGGNYSKQETMLVLGSMNGWGDNNPDLTMTLVDDFVWEVDGVSMVDSDEFLFLNDDTFDPKWGDSGCDGVADPGGVNIACGFSGDDLTFRFNDRTLEYSVE